MWTFSQLLSPIRIARAGWRDRLPPGPGRWPYLGLELAVTTKENPLGTMLQWVRDYGRVFTTRFLGMNQVWMIGPEANQYVLVDNAQNFSWHDGHLGDLIPFIGEGLLTTDGHVHDRARALMQPVFSKRRIANYGDAMVQRAAAALAKLRVDQEVEIYHWTRELALSIAVSLLFGMTPDSALCHELSTQFERGLGYYGVFFHLQLLRGPGTPWAKMLRARNAIDRVLYAEITERRRRGSRGENILDLLLNSRDGNERFSDQEVRDQVMTLLFAGHDTTTATVAWMMTKKRTSESRERNSVKCDGT